MDKINGGMLEIDFIPVKKNSSKGQVIIPLNYRELFLSFFYSLLDKEEGDFLHNTGYIDPVSKRRFKLFTFSNILPIKVDKEHKHNESMIERGKIRGNHNQQNSKIEYQRDKKLIFFQGYNKFRIIIASVKDEIIYALISKLFKKEIMNLGKEKFVIESVNIKKFPEYKKQIKVKTLSPIVVYSTLYFANRERKKTYYYNPFERDFENLIIENLNRKYRAFTGEKDLILSGSIKPVRVKPRGDERIIKFKNTVLKAWDGTFELELPPPLFYIAFGAGIGCKNSLGFGCVGEI